MLNPGASWGECFEIKTNFYLLASSVSNSAKWSHTSATPQSGQSLFTNTAFSKCSEILMMPHHTKDVLVDLTLHSYGLVFPVSWEGHCETLLLWFALFITWIIYFYYVSIFQQCLYIKVYINLLCIKWIIIFLYHSSQVLNTSVVDEVLFLMDCNNVSIRDVKLLFNPFFCILCIALV